MVTDAWTIECNDALRVALSLGGLAAKSQWDNQRQDWITTDRPRVELESLNLSSFDLRNFDFSRCRFNGCDFTGANLSSADLSQSIFRNCDLTGANIKGATFYAADLNHAGNRMVGMTFDSTTNIEVNRGQLAPEMDQALKDMAHAGWARSTWAIKRFRSPLFRFINWSTQYGSSMWRLSAITFFVVFAFGILYWWLTPGITILESQAISVKYFLNINDYYNDYSSFLAWVGFAEVISGLFALAVVISIFTRKFSEI